jgi:hypothetical protein
MTDGRKCLFDSESSILFDISLFKLFMLNLEFFVFHRIITAAVLSHLLYCPRHRLSSAILRYIFTLFIFKQLKGGTLLF